MLNLFHFIIILVVFFIVSVIYYYISFPPDQDPLFILVVSLVHTVLLAIALMIATFIYECCKYIWKQCKEE